MKKLSSSEKTKLQKDIFKIVKYSPHLEEETIIDQYEDYILFYIAFETLAEYKNGDLSIHCYSQCVNVITLDKMLKIKQAIQNAVDVF